VKVDDSGSIDIGERLADERARHWRSCLLERLWLLRKGSANPVDQAAG
jgi:hypothetical protein